MNFFSLTVQILPVLFLSLFFERRTGSSRTARDESKGFFLAAAVVMVLAELLCLSAIYLFDDTLLVADLWGYPGRTIHLSYKMLFNSICSSMAWTALAIGFIALLAPQFARQREQISSRKIHGNSRKFLFYQTLALLVAICLFSGPLWLILRPAVPSLSFTWWHALCALCALAGACCYLIAYLAKASETCMRMLRGALSCAIITIIVFGVALLYSMETVAREAKMLRIANFYAEEVTQSLARKYNATILDYHAFIKQLNDDSRQRKANVDSLQPLSIVSDEASTLDWEYPPPRLLENILVQSQVDGKLSTCRLLIGYLPPKKTEPNVRGRLSVDAYCIPEIAQ